MIDIGGTGRSEVSAIIRGPDGSIRRVSFEVSDTFCGYSVKAVRETDGRGVIRELYAIVEFPDGDRRFEWRL